MYHSGEHDWFVAEVGTGSGVRAPGRGRGSWRLASARCRWLLKQRAALVYLFFLSAGLRLCDGYSAVYVCVRACVCGQPLAGLTHWGGNDSDDQSGPDRWLQQVSAPVEFAAWAACGRDTHKHNKCDRLNAAGANRTRLSLVRGSSVSSSGGGVWGW